MQTPIYIWFYVIAFVQLQTVSLSDSAPTTPKTQSNLNNQVQPTVVNSTGNYLFGAQGFNHVSSYNCKSNPKNRVAGYCILTIPDAVAQCNSDANCGGYDVTTNAGWHKANDVNGQTVVQLFTAGAPTNPSAEWKFYSKPATTGF
ncbi:unnamed protein product [Rotaria magnacalcarata]|uniref:Uncharacterized protein n=1 Tax=Rotaria magnacalcarata TaxID=392030 RepID=A0A816Z175_9BILA|nr:unnamed protein product [Rotaria magnacalcarata]